jgi:hypothetical protein
VALAPGRFTCVLQVCACFAPASSSGFKKDGPTSWNATQFLRSRQMRRTARSTPHRDAFSARLNCTRLKTTPTNRKNGAAVAPMTWVWSERYCPVMCAGRLASTDHSLGVHHVELDPIGDLARARSRRTGREDARVR